MHDTDPVSAGHWRTEQVWIGGGNFGPRGADYIAPHHTRVPGTIDDLLEFTRRTDVPTLPQIAIVHAQFETIHPFTDGNGRTGRPLIQAMLRHKRLTRQVTVPISAGLLTRMPTSAPSGPIATVIPRQSSSGFRKHRCLRWRTAADWSTTSDQSAKNGMPELQLVATQLFFNAQLLRRELDISTGNARRYVNPLTDAGIIVEFTDRARNRAWRAPEVLSALDALAVRAGRRSLPD